MLSCLSPLRNQEFRNSLIGCPQKISLSLFASRPFVSSDATTTQLSSIHQMASLSKAFYMSIVTSAPNLSLTAPLAPCSVSALNLPYLPPTPPSPPLRLLRLRRIPRLPIPLVRSLLARLCSHCSARLPVWLRTQNPRMVLSRFPLARRGNLPPRFFALSTRLPPKTLAPRQICREGTIQAHDA